MTKLPEPILRYILQEIFPESDSDTELIAWEYPEVRVPAVDATELTDTITIELSPYHVILEDYAVRCEYEIEAAYRRLTDTIWYRNPRRLAQKMKS